jgi:hypothetical protein
LKHLYMVHSVYLTQVNAFPRRHGEVEVRTEGKSKNKYK